MLSASKTLLIVLNSHRVWMCRARYQSPSKTRLVARVENALTARNGRRARRARSSVITASLASSSASTARLVPENRRSMSSARFFADSMIFSASNRCLGPRFFAASIILPASSRCLGFVPDRGRNTNILGMLQLAFRFRQPASQAGWAGKISPSYTARSIE